MIALTLRRFIRSWPLLLALGCSACFARAESDPPFASVGNSVGKAFEAAFDGLGEAFAGYFEQFAKVMREHPTELRLIMEQSCVMPIECPVEPDPNADPTVSLETLQPPCLEANRGWNPAFQAAYVRCLSRCEAESHCLDEALFLSTITRSQLQRKSDCEAAQSSCGFVTDACTALAALEDEVVVEEMQACVAEPCETRASCFVRVLLPELQWSTPEQLAEQQGEPDDL